MKEEYDSGPLTQNKSGVNSGHDYKEGKKYAIVFIKIILSELNNNHNPNNKTTITVGSVETK